jgi:hypothetical protein
VTASPLRRRRASARPATANTAPAAKSSQRCVVPEKIPIVTRMLQAPTSAVPRPTAMLTDRAIARPASTAPIEIAKSIDVEVDDENANVATIMNAPATASS